MLNRAQTWMRSVLLVAVFASSALAQNTTRVLPTSPTQLPQAQVTPPAAAPVVQMRDIDRATVRIVALSGWNDARNARGAQMLEPIAGHGTGVLISADGAILTARHVIEGAGIIAVFLPGEDRARPARVTFMDPVRDLAFLSISREATLFPFLPVPASAPALVASATVSASGYPLEVRERFPAAASGYLSRMTNDNRLQLAIPLNPGNSGGPVIDAQNVLIGIVSQGADPTHGAQGITIAEPAWEAYGPYQNTVRPLMNNTPHITDPVAESEAAHLIAGMLTDERGRLSYDDCLRAESDGGSRGPILALFGAYAWNRAQDDSTVAEERTRWFDLAERLIARAAQTPSLSQAPNFASIFRLHGCLANTACRANLQRQAPAASTFVTGGVTPSTFTRAPATEEDKPDTLPDWRAMATVALIHDELTQSFDTAAFRTHLEGARALRPFDICRRHCCLRRGLISRARDLGWRTQRGLVATFCDVSSAWQPRVWCIAWLT